MPALLDNFVLSNSKTIMNNFIREVNGFKTNIVIYDDTHSFYFEKKALVCIG